MSLGRDIDRASAVALEVVGSVLMFTPAALLGAFMLGTGALLSVGLALTAPGASNRDTGTSYRVIRNGQARRIPCAALTSLHLLRDSSTNCAVSYPFEMIGA